MQLVIVPGDVQKLMHFVKVAPNLNFHPETVVKSAKCIVLFLQPIETLQPKTWSIHNTIFIVHIHHVHVSCF